MLIPYMWYICAHEFWWQFGKQYSLKVKQHLLNLLYLTKKYNAHMVYVRMCTHQVCNAMSYL